MSIWEGTEKKKKRTIAVFILKKIENNCLRKAIDLKKSKNIYRVGLELITQIFADRKARLAPYIEKKISGRITEKIRLFIALLQDTSERENASTPRIAVA